eukprot:scaffold53763_cov66-Phaeocystis_antarctica.AAC.2
MSFRFAFENLQTSVARFSELAPAAAPAATLSSESAAPASHGRENTGLAVVPDSISITKCRCVGENLAAASETASSAQAGGGAFY